MLKGGCFCGRIRYEAAGTSFNETSCHCSICRRTTGAAFVTWFSVPRSQFRLVRGEPTRFPSSAKGTRSFCPRCGTQLTFEHQDLSGSSKLAWVKLADQLPAYREGRQEG